MRQTKHSRGQSRRSPTSREGKTSDWGETRPFWCLDCGHGCGSVEQVLAHYSKASHGNETMSVGSRGLTKRQQEQAFKLRYK